MPRRSRGVSFGLHAARAVDQDLEIVHAAQQILLRLQPVQLRGRSRARQLALNLERVAQLLGGDAHPVEAIGQVDPAGMLDRGAQLDGASLGLRGGFSERAPLRHRARRRRGDADQPLAQLVELRGLDRGQHLATPLLPLVVHRFANAGDGAHGSGALFGQLVQ